MPIHVGWLIENRVGVIKIIGSYTIEDFHPAIKWLVMGFKESPHLQTFTILDATQQKTHPQLNAFRGLPNDDAKDA